MLIRVGQNLSCLSGMETEFPMGTIIHNHKDVGCAKCAFVVEANERNTDLSFSIAFPCPGKLLEDCRVMYCFVNTSNI